MEIFNGTGAAIGLSAGGYDVQIFANGSSSATSTIVLTGTVADGDVYVVANSSATGAVADAAVFRKARHVVESSRHELRVGAEEGGSDLGPGRYAIAGQADDEEASDCGELVKPRAPRPAGAGATLSAGRGDHVNR